MLLSWILVLLGLFFLYIGAEGFVKGAVSIARRTGIAEYAIGATLVAFGTSLPELAAGVYAAYKGSTDISVSNVVGSNIFNIGLALGLPAAFFSIKTEREIFHLDIPTFFASIILLFLLSFDGTLSRLDGTILLVSFVTFTIYLLRDREVIDIEEIPKDTYSIPISLVIIAISGILLYIGARFLVNGGVHIARNLGVSEWVIGATVVAIGTSAPEFFTSFAALRHNEDELSVGNIIGSNIINIFLALGAASLTRPLPVSHVAIYFDFVSMFFFSLLIAFMLSDRKISQESGVWLLLLLVAYILGMMRMHR